MARSRVLIDPDRPDAAHPIMLPPARPAAWDQRSEGMTEQPPACSYRHAPDPDVSYVQLQPPPLLPGEQQLSLDNPNRMR